MEIYIFFYLKYIKKKKKKKKLTIFKILYLKFYLKFIMLEFINFFKSNIVV